MHNATHAPRSRVEEIVKLQVGYNLIVQVENELKLVLHSLGYEEIHGSVDREADLIRNQAEKTNFLFVVSTRIKSAQAQYSEPARLSG
jgi:hypothetical protein